jgi:WD40 repeat protein
MANDYHFVEGNQKILNLWKIEGSNVTKKAAKLGKKCPSNTSFFSMAQLVSSSSSSSYQTIIGNSSGDLLILEGRELGSVVEKAHNGAIFCLTTNASHSLMISGGKDGKIQVWNISLQSLGSFSLSSVYSQQIGSFSSSLPLFDSSIIAVNIKPSSSSSSSSFSGDNEHLSFIVGTSGGNLLEVSIPNSNGEVSSSKKGNSSSSSVSNDGNKSQSYNFDKLAVSSLVTSHTKGELWGLATHPFDHDLYATAGDDSILRVWSIKKNACLVAKKLPKAARCVAWHPIGSLLAVAFLSNDELNRKAGKGGGKAKKGSGKAGAKATPIAANAKKGSANSTDTVEDPLGYAIDDEEGMGDAGELSKVPSDAMILLFAFSSSGSGSGDLKFVAFGGLPYSTSDKKILVDGSKGKAGENGLISLASVSDFKFSPNGSFLVAGGHDCKITGYQLPLLNSGDMKHPHWDDWKKSLEVPFFVFNKHSSCITHLDISNDSCYLQSNDLGNELLFFDLTKFKQEPSASKLADYNNHHIYNSHEEDDDGEDGPGGDEGTKLWASQTCVFGWSVQGIWPATAYDSSDINAIDRNVGMKFLATAEDSGTIRVLRYPAVLPNSQSLSLTGHSSHVTCVRWTIGTHLISVGGNDKSVFVWQFSDR